MSRALCRDSGGGDSPSSRYASATEKPTRAHRVPATSQSKHRLRAEGRRQSVWKCVPRRECRLSRAHRGSVRRTSHECNRSGRRVHNQAPAKRSPLTVVSAPSTETGTWLAARQLSSSAPQKPASATSHSATAPPLRRGTARAKPDTTPRPDGIPAAGTARGGASGAPPAVYTAASPGAVPEAPPAASGSRYRRGAGSAACSTPALESLHGRASSGSHDSHAPAPPCL
mmetsp:Transcript_16421/g.53524  ORF Transcript_16421/g.53524 Transcript_16421/m.53524 type:complete len:228 (-) Transcript_16421:32-715(-)